MHTYIDNFIIFKSCKIIFFFKVRTNNFEELRAVNGI